MARQETSFFELRQGAIVWETVLDSSGRTGKYPRPIIVISSDQQIVNGTTIFGVAISSSNYRPESSRYLVELPWHPEGHHRTGLRKKCHAVCNWIVPLRASAETQVRGQLPRKWLLRILEQIDNLRRESGTVDPDTTG